ncbi:MAG: feoA [Evtepia sp.]|nr:feoA [Evtepia sp.]
MKKVGAIEMNTLKDVAVGQAVHVVKVHGDGPIRRRIMDMGLTKDTELYVQKVAPFGDPVEVIVRGYSLSLRKADAERIEVR